MTRMVHSHRGSKCEGQDSYIVPLQNNTWRKEIQIVEEVLLKL